MRRGIFCILILVLVIVASGWLGGKIPSGFVPTEDQGYLFANLTLPESASLQRTAVATKQVGDILRNTPGVPIPPRAIPGIGTSERKWETRSAFGRRTRHFTADRRRQTLTHSALR